MGQSFSGGKYKSWTRWHWMSTLNQRIHKWKSVVKKREGQAPQKNRTRQKILKKLMMWIDKKNLYPFWSDEKHSFESAASEHNKFKFIWNSENSDMYVGSMFVERMRNLIVNMIGHNEIDIILFFGIRNKKNGDYRSAIDFAKLELFPGVKLERYTKYRWLIRSSKLIYRN